MSLSDSSALDVCDSESELSLLRSDVATISLLDPESDPSYATCCCKQETSCAHLPVVTRLNDQGEAKRLGWKRLDVGRSKEAGESPGTSMSYQPNPMKTGQR